jgi:GDP-L-fucose synthase
MQTEDRVFVAGSDTMKGQALVRRLKAEGGVRIVGLGAEAPNLRDRDAVDCFLASARPDQVFVVAGQHAGIAGNLRRPADLMVDNLLIATSIIPAAARHGVKKLLYLASSCVYPRMAPQPMAVTALDTGPVEPTSAAYATAKIAGMKLADAYRRQNGSPFVTAIAADAYGPGDDFTDENAHVLGALIRRMHEARQNSAPAVDIWGTGAPQREFIYVDDLADACLCVIRQYDGPEPINLGVGVATSIAELAGVVRDVVGYTGTLRFDTTRPDGMPVKSLDSGLLRSLGWRPAWTLRAGVEETFQWFLRHHSAATLGRSLGE